jgi:S1-C subfamily serine protease
MSIYDLPKFKLPKFLKNRVFQLAVLLILISSLFGFLAGLASGSFFYLQIKDYLSTLDIEIPEGKTTIIGDENKFSSSPLADARVEKEYPPQTTQEEAIIKAVEDAWPAVVSIVATKDVPIIEEYFYDPFEIFDEEFFGIPRIQIPQYREGGETKKQEIGGGTGFIVSEDGLVLTNKHVVFDEAADYTVFANDGEKYPAKVLAKNPIYDIAILKIEKNGPGQFSTVKFGDSENLRPGQTVIAIGNALGEFKNTVSVGVVSALGRTVTASGGGMVETLEDVIQTDAAINRGNSGGPLLNLKGEVIGINTAMVLDAQNIGFAIPIKQAEKSIEQIKDLGKIVYPFLGIRYVLINEIIKEEYNLSVDYGAWITRGSQGESAIEPGSEAQKAGLMEDDIILEFNGEKITQEKSLVKIIMKYDPGDKINLKVLRNEREIAVQAILGEKS